MTEINIDNFPELSHTIDIGGDRYFMGTQKPIESGFKNRKHYLNVFGNERETERLLRKYMFYSLKDKKNIVFESQEDKMALLKILKDWVRKTKTNPLYNSPILKNTIIRRSCLNVEQLIQQLENSDNKEFKIPDIDILPCTKAKKYIKEIPDDHKFQMILEMSWYLLHPDNVPSEIGCDWAKLVKELERLRMGDIVQQIHDVEQTKSISSSKNALNYFKKINLQTVVKKDKIENALDQSKKFATEIQDETASDSVKKRLKLLLEILEMKKYLAKDIDIDRDDTISNDEMKTIERSMITNPMKGGAALTLNKPLGAAMNPLFDYFKVVYDPIYSFLEKSIKEYQKTNQIIIPQLTTLLHICNNLKADTYGVYRITNVDKELLEFIKFMINVTNQYIGTLRDDVNKNIFNKRLFKLPKVRLSSISDEKSIVTINKNVYKDPTILPSIQFFIMGANIKYHTLPTLKLADNTEEAIKKFYQEGNIYMVYTESQNISQNIPINVYDIDYNTVDVTTNIKIKNIPDNYFNTNKDRLSEIYLENILDIKQYIVYNDAELALSIFIALKELMPHIE